MVRAVCCCFLESDTTSFTGNLQDLEFNWQIIVGSIIGFFGAAFGSVGGVGATSTRAFLKGIATWKKENILKKAFGWYRFRLGSPVTSLYVTKLISLAHLRSMYGSLIQIGSGLGLMGALLLKSSSYTINIILDMVTAASIQSKEMGPTSSPSELAKGIEQSGEKKKGFRDWKKLIKPANEEKDHWMRL